jgi:hypothetical protein
MDFNAFTIKESLEWVQNTCCEDINIRCCKFINIAKINYELLCDVKTLLGFACVFPLLEIV